MVLVGLSGSACSVPRLASLMVAVATVALSASAQVSSWVQSPINGHWYGRTANGGTWFQAQADAAQLGGNLATIRSATENEWIRTSLVLPTSLYAWIGLTDQAAEGTFTWMSGEPVTYTNWGVGEPNNQGNEDWVAMDVTMQPPGAWNDSPGLGSLPGIIEVISGDCNINQIPDRTEVTTGAAPDCNGNGIPDTCDIVSGSSVDANGDGQPDECQPAGFTFCAGDGSGAVCPCDPGQAGTPGEGCRHSHGLGAKLSGIGTARIAQDSLRLTASQLPPSATALLFQGTTMQNGGLGFPFGDGLLCVNGAIVRLSIRQATGGVLSWGAGNPGDAPLHLAGSIPASGGTRFYQVWYRDPSPYCTPSGFNLTGGRSITWTP